MAVISKNNCEVIKGTGASNKCMPPIISDKDNPLIQEHLKRKQIQLEALRYLHPFYFNFNTIQFQLEKKAFRVLR